jgi:kynurenine formamidase
MLLDNFPGLRHDDLPDGEGWAFEIVTMTTHNGTHMGAPVHFQSKSIDGKRMMSIDEVPLDWFFRPGKLDFREMPDGHVVKAAEMAAELQRVGHELKPFDIVLVNTRAATAGCGMGREATLYLTSHGVRVCGIDAWGWDVPFAHMRKRWLDTHDPSIIWFSSTAVAALWVFSVRSFHEPIAPNSIGTSSVCNTHNSRYRCRQSAVWCVVEERAYRGVGCLTLIGPLRPLCAFWRQCCARPLNSSGASHGRPLRPKLGPTLSFGSAPARRDSATLRGLPDAHI